MASVNDRPIEGSERRIFGPRPEAEHGLDFASPTFSVLLCAQLTLSNATPGQLDHWPAADDGRIQGDPLSKLSPDCRAVMNHFVYSMANGLLGHPVLESIDYRPILIEESSAAEQACAIFCNVLELDADGRPINANEAEIRAAQYIRSYCDASYEVDPPFEDWETDRPLRTGKKLGPMP